MKIEHEVSHDNVGELIAVLHDRVYDKLHNFVDYFPTDASGDKSAAKAVLHQLHEAAVNYVNMTRVAREMHEAVPKKKARNK